MVRRRVLLYDEDVRLGWFNPDEAELVESFEEAFDVTQLFRLADGRFALWRWPKWDRGETPPAQFVSGHDVIEWCLEHDRDIPTDLRVEAQRSNVLNVPPAGAPNSQPPAVADVRPPQALLSPDDGWPPNAGWHFRPGQYAHDGKSFNLTGAAWRLLKHLASNHTRHFPLGELRDAVCGDRSPTSEASMRPLLTSLRDILRANHGLPADSDPIPQEGRGPGAVWWIEISNRRKKKPATKRKSKKKANPTIKQRSAQR
ncbi:MAG TPA: helix-turn-helix domain-containing protein [Pirellulales bacterium]|nr:helix-turn-helix domain-containing protein [Pirellulales bacterium]